MTLVALPLYVVLKQFGHLAVALAIVLGTSLILKFTWYNHLIEREVETAKEAA